MKSLRKISKVLDCFTKAEPRNSLNTISKKNFSIKKKIKIQKKKMDQSIRLDLFPMACLIQFAILTFHEDSF